jgi:hypothetical protein
MTEFNIGIFNISQKQTEPFYHILCHICNQSINAIQKCVCPLYCSLCNRFMCDECMKCWKITNTHTGSNVFKNETDTFCEFWLCIECINSIKTINHSYFIIQLMNNKY